MFRIIKYSHGFILEEYRKGGINQRTKQPAQPHWQAVGYYGKLSDLAIGALNKAIVIPDGTLNEQLAALPEIIKQTAETLAEQLNHNSERKL